MTGYPQFVAGRSRPALEGPPAAFIDATQDIWCNRRFPENLGLSALAPAKPRETVKASSESIELTVS
jgi:hypothetical protein